VEHDLEITLALLERTPAVLNALLRGLPELWTGRNEGEGTWNASEIVAHLIHCERTDWMPRARIVLQHGEARAFDPLDRSGNLRESEGKPLGTLLDEFARLRAASLEELRAMNLREQDLNRRGRHPSLGVVTLSQLLAAWAAHDLTHLHQLTRVMAYQYRETVGPWGKYLGVMQCAGHSSAA
jgi:hypothetical protein